MNILGLLVKLITIKDRQKREITQKYPTHNPHDFTKMLICILIPQDLQMFIGDISFTQLIFLTKY